MRDLREQVRVEDDKVSRPRSATEENVVIRAAQIDPFRPRMVRQLRDMRHHHRGANHLGPYPGRRRPHRHPPVGAASDQPEGGDGNEEGERDGREPAGGARKRSPAHVRLQARPAPAKGIA
jgi:hypothetical protein